MGAAGKRDLEFDLRALSERLRSDDEFADEMYCALCNSEWSHEDGGHWHGSWRYAADLVAALRGRGERYIDFYYSVSRNEGTISDRVAEAMGKLGWTGTRRGLESFVTNLDEPNQHGTSADIIDAD